MPILAEMRQKYRLEGAKYEPNPECKFCQGAGERPLKHREGMTFCICLFVNHEMSDFAGDSLAATAKKLKSELLRRV